jgi:acetyltransferase
MTIEHLDCLLKPKSVVVIALCQEGRILGKQVLKNLLQGGYQGTLMAVTDESADESVVDTFNSIKRLPSAVDLAVLCDPVESLPSQLEALSAMGTFAVAVLPDADPHATVFAELLATARALKIRMLGPDSMGVITPKIGLQASISHCQARQGRVAFVSQSQGIAATVMDWAEKKKIGFSHVLTLGAGADIDFGDIIDYLGRDPQTKAILLHVDCIRERRSFLSAARSVARGKTILIVKSGRSIEGEAQADLVFDAAIRRAGMLRVHEVHEMFTALETLTWCRPPRSDRLLIVTNSQGPAMMALDVLSDMGGTPVVLDSELVDSLPVAQLRPGLLRIDDKDGDDVYATVCQTLEKNRITDGLLVIYTPAVHTEGMVVAQSLIDYRKKKFGGPLLFTNWTGEGSAQASRQLFTESGVPTFRTPEGAVRAFMHLVQFKQNQRTLLETPESIPDFIAANLSMVRPLLQEALRRGETTLETHQAAPVLKAYGLMTTETRLAKTAQEAAHHAAELGFPVAVKLCSRDIPYKSEVGGVVLNLDDEKAVLNVANAMQLRVRRLFPEAEQEGFVVQQMVDRGGAQELRISVIQDPLFGPAILLGETGGVQNISQEVVAALPPLNMALARELVNRALVEGKIHDRRLPGGMVPEALYPLLVHVSQLIIDCPEIESLEINPLLLSGSAATVLDVNINLAEPTCSGPERLAIRPYPKELEERCLMNSGREVVLRPILPEDERAHLEFDEKVTDDDRYMRFFTVKKDRNHDVIAPFVHIDYDREMAFIVSAIDQDGNPETLGVARAVTDPDNYEAEFAVMIRSDLKGEGLGARLMRKVIDYCRQRNTKFLTGITMTENRKMVGLAKHLGFQTKTMIADGEVAMTLSLQESTTE